MLYANLHHYHNPGDSDTRLIRCPTCGRLETWHELEVANHGHCRHYGEPCAICREASEKRRGNL